MEEQRQIFQKLRQDDPLNKVCIDCQSANPQWCSASFGCFICLECSGTHRSLGSHISFVRSLTMDTFKPYELAKMIAGGNSRLKLFFDKYGVPMNLPIKQKYDNAIAAQYREKLKAEAEGQQWTAPPDLKYSPNQTAAPALQQVRDTPTSQRTKQSSKDDWGSWEDDWDAPAPKASSSNTNLRGSASSQSPSQIRSSQDMKSPSQFSRASSQGSQGYGTSSQTNGSSSQGYNNSSQGYGNSSQGYGNSSQGYGNSSQGYGNSSQGSSRAQSNFTNTPARNSGSTSSTEDSLSTALESGWSVLSGLASMTLESAKTLGEKTAEFSKDNLGAQDWNTEELKNSVYEKTSTGWGVFTSYLSKAKDATSEYVSYAADQLTKDAEPYPQQQGQQGQSPAPRYTMPVPQQQNQPQNHYQQEQQQQQPTQAPQPTQKPTPNKSPAPQKTKTEEEEFNAWLDDDQDNSGWDVGSKPQSKKASSLVQKNTGATKKNLEWDDWD